jgi:regulator of protease activity HflC (stomatin/prohibitin superfamily)
MSVTDPRLVNPSKEIVYGGAMSGWLMLAVIVALIAFAAASFMGRVPAAGVPLAMLIVFLAIGFLVLQPNESAVLTLFGKYKGTARTEGFWWVNPLYAKHKISLRMRNFTTPTLKVNDKTGNPVEVAAVAVWRVQDTAQAAFDVDDFEGYIKTQVEVSLRDVVSTHPYDATRDEHVSLRGNTPAIAELLKSELQRAVDVAGLDVQELRITHLAYAPEVASIMLRRQQAEALIQAREKMVDGAIGMVKMALTRFNDEGITEFTQAQRAQMVTNMMTVLLSENGATPVIPTTASA